MAEPPGFAGQNPLLSGLFGVLQQAAQGHQTTADVWQALRTAAGTWQAQAAGTAGELSQAELEENGRQVLSASGVGIQEVNTYRANAGQWLSAKEALHAAGDQSQITAKSIFVPPWATSTSNAEPSRYRVRVNWQLSPTVGEAFSKWSSYELTAPISNIEDVLAQAGSKAADDKYIYLLSGGAPPEISDYEVEQI